MSELNEKTKALRKYRKQNPRSRATQICKLYGSTSHRRIRTCIFCREEHTSAAAWPEPKHSLDFIKYHEEHCVKNYLTE